MVEYVDPTNGRPGVQDHDVLRPDAAARARRRCPCGRPPACWSRPFEGKGHSIVDGKRFDWKRFDTLAVPGGGWCEHVNGSRQRARLPVRRQRRARAARLRPAQEMGPRRSRRHGALTESVHGWPAPVAAIQLTSFASGVSCRASHTTLTVAHRLPRRRPGLGRGHDALSSATCAGRAARRSTTCRTRAARELLATHRPAARAGTRTRCGWRTAS